MAELDEAEQFLLPLEDLCIASDPFFVVPDGCKPSRDPLADRHFLAEVKGE
jgi:hypothetical protein